MQYSTGCKALDNLMGGYYTRVIHEVYGPTKAGKTTLGTYIPIGQIYLYHLKKRKKVPEKGRFIVVDGDGGFDYDRAEQVWTGLGIEDCNEVFKKLIYWQPTEFATQHKMIVHEIDETIKTKKIVPLFIAADPLCAIYRGIVLRTDMRYKMVTIGGYTGKLDLQLITLRKHAVKYNLPVVISSWPGSPVGKALGAKDGETPVIGGRALGFIPKVMVELRIPKQGTLIREAILYKHRSRPEGGACYFKLTQTGVEDVTAKDLQILELTKGAGK